MDYSKKQKIVRAFIRGTSLERIKKRHGITNRILYSVLDPILKRDVVHFGYESKYLTIEPEEWLTYVHATEEDLTEFSPRELNRAESYRKLIK